MTRAIGGQGAPEVAEGFWSLGAPPFSDYLK